MNRSIMLETAHRKWIAVPLLIWYVLLSSHVAFVLPAFALGNNLSYRSAPVEEIDQHAQQDTPVQPLPHHEPHTETQATLCVICDASVLVFDTVPDTPLQHLLPVNVVAYVPSLFRYAERQDQTIPAAPVPDPPLKIPISLG